jgi:hypothetical protein
VWKSADYREWWECNFLGLLAPATVPAHVDPSTFLLLDLVPASSNPPFTLSTPFRVLSAASSLTLSILRILQVSSNTQKRNYELHFFFFFSITGKSNTSNSNWTAQEPQRGMDKVILSFFSSLALSFFLSLLFLLSGVLAAKGKCFMALA